MYELVRTGSDNRKLYAIVAGECVVDGTIAEQLNATLNGAENQVLAQKPTSNSAAYDAYLRGLGQLAVVTVTSLNDAVHAKEEIARIPTNRFVQIFGAFPPLSKPGPIPSKVTHAPGLARPT